MLKACAGAAMAAALAGGCATLPSSPNDEIMGVSEKDIFRAVQCELNEAKQRGRQLSRAIDSYDLKLELDLKLVNDTNAGASAVLVLPQAPEVVSAGFGASLTGKARRQTVLTIEIDPRELPKKLAKDACPKQSGLPETPLNLGVRDWAASTFGALDSGEKVVLTSGTYEIEFVLTRAANGSIGVVAHRVTAASFGLGASQASTHRLKLAATARGDPVPTAPVEVIIANWPAAAPFVSGRKAAAGKSSAIQEPSDQSVAPSARRRFGPDTSERLNRLLERGRPLNIQPY